MTVQFFTPLIGPYFNEVNIIFFLFPHQRYGFCQQKAQQYKLNYSLPTINQTCPLPLLDHRHNSPPDQSINRKPKCGDRQIEEFVWWTWKMRCEPSKQERLILSQFHNAMPVSQRVGCKHGGATPNFTSKIIESHSVKAYLCVSKFNFYFNASIHSQRMEYVLIPMKLRNENKQPLKWMESNIEKLFHIFYLKLIRIAFSVARGCFGSTCDGQTMLQWDKGEAKGKLWKWEYSIESMCRTKFGRKASPKTSIRVSLAHCRTSFEFPSGSFCVVHFNHQWMDQIILFFTLFFFTRNLKSHCDLTLFIQKAIHY